MDYNNVNFIRVFIISAITFIILSGLPFAEKNTNLKPSLKRGLFFLENSKPDSAIVNFVKAYSAGLSRDSLFYFWSEALLQKNAFDSSLAANFMVKESHRGLFKIQILKQRQTIYNSLGWRKEASKLLDTIYSLPEYHRLMMIPELEVNFFAGYGKEALVSDTSQPWGTGSGSSLRQPESYISGGMDFKSIWQTKRKGRTFSTGISGSLSRITEEISLNGGPTDSAEITSSVFGSITGKSITSTCNLSVNRRFDDSLFIGASVESGMIGSNKWMPMLWSGASVYTTTDFNISNARSWVFFLAQQQYSHLFKINFHAFFNLLLSRNTEFLHTKIISVLYADDARLQYPVFYTDQAFTTIIDTSYFRLISGQITKDIQASSTDSIIISKLTLPNSNLSFAPRISFSLTFKVPIQLGFGWKLNYFFKPYKWDIISNDAQYLIYSRSDELYYKIPPDLIGITTTKGTNGGIAISPAVQPGQFKQTHMSMMRIDNTISADLSIQLFDKKFGTGTIRSTVSKVWSTLSGKAPIDIQSWNFSSFIEWKIRTQNAINKI